MFLTKFTLKDKKLRIYDNHDNVDRLSYVDNVVQIRRFMQSGQALRMSRYQTQFCNTNDALTDQSMLGLGVYQTDPAEVSAIASQIPPAVPHRAETAKPGSPAPSGTQSPDLDNVKPATAPPSSAPPTTT